MHWKKLIEENVRTRQKIHYRGITGWWYDDRFMEIYWQHPRRQVTIIAELEDDIYVVDAGNGGK